VKKTELRKIIREEINGILNEQQDFRTAVKKGPGFVDDNAFEPGVRIRKKGDKLYFRNASRELGSFKQVTGGSNRAFASDISDGEYILRKSAPGRPAGIVLLTLRKSLR